MAAARDSDYQRENNLARLEVATVMFPRTFLVGSPRERQEAMRLIPEHVPSGVRVGENLTFATKARFGELVSSVRGKGCFDWKRGGRVYESFGNWFYGVMTRQAGWPTFLSRLGAGAAQIAAGSAARQGDWTQLFESTFGDDARDQDDIAKGVAAWERYMEEIESLGTSPLSEFVSDRRDTYRWQSEDDSWSDDGDSVD